MLTAIDGLEQNNIHSSKRRISLQKTNSLWWLRPSALPQWLNPRAFGVVMASIIPSSVIISFCSRYAPGYGYIYRESAEIARTKTHGCWTVSDLRLIGNIPTTHQTKMDVLMKLVLIIHLCKEVQVNFVQSTWKVIDSMTDVYTNSSVLSSHQQVTCIECATRTLMLDGEGLSCNRGDQMCMIYSTCHIKDLLTLEDWGPIGGWLHFCTKMKLTTEWTGTWLDLGIPLAQRKLIRFQIKAINNVYIGLISGHSKGSPGFWVFLGGLRGTKSCLFDELLFKSQCYSEYSGLVTSGEQYRSFWVTWNEGHVRVGTGETLGNGTIMDHVFPNVYTVRHALIGTPKCKGDWVIYL